MRISATFACLWISAFVILCSSTSNMLMLRMARKLWWWNTWRECLMELVMVQDSQPQRTVLSAVAVYTVTVVSRSIFGCLKKDLRAPRSLRKQAWGRGKELEPLHHLVWRLYHMGCYGFRCLSWVWGQNHHAWSRLTRFMVFSGAPYISKSSYRRSWSAVLKPLQRSTKSAQVLRLWFLLSLVMERKE